MEENKKNDKIVYDIDEGIKKQRVNGQWLSLPNSNNSLTNNNIPQNDQKVNSDISTNSNMQNNEKNVQKETTKEVKKAIDTIKKTDNSTLYRSKSEYKAQEPSVFNNIPQNEQKVYFYLFNFIFLNSSSPMISLISFK